MKTINPTSPESNQEQVLAMGQWREPVEMAEVHSESPIGMIILLEARKMGLRIELFSEGIRFIKK